MNSVGTRNSSANVPTIMPPTTPEPSVELPLAPTPCESTSGIMPNTHVRTVIRIGRKRALAADTAACERLMPPARRSAAYSVIRMAVFDSRPISMMMPVWR